MKVTIELDLDNDAYQTPTIRVPFGFGKMELRRVNMEAVISSQRPDPSPRMPILDENGNVTGYATIHTDGGQ